jgi:hypothetical protein
VEHEDDGRDHRPRAVPAAAGGEVMVREARQQGHTPPQTMQKPWFSSCRWTWARVLANGVVGDMTTPPRLGRLPDAGRLTVITTLLARAGAA